jgi:hypothetical protein
MLAMLPMLAVKPVPRTSNRNQAGADTQPRTLTLALASRLSESKRFSYPAHVGYTDKTV